MVRAVNPAELVPTRHAWEIMAGGLKVRAGRRMAVDGLDSRVVELGQDVVEAVGLEAGQRPAGAAVVGRVGDEVHRRVAAAVQRVAAWHRLP